jgi:hypothetical protein
MRLISKYILYIESNDFDGYHAYLINQKTYLIKRRGYCLINGKNCRRRIVDYYLSISELVIYANEMTCHIGLDSVAVIIFSIKINSVNELIERLMHRPEPSNYKFVLRADC